MHFRTLWEAREEVAGAVTEMFASLLATDESNTKVQRLMVRGERFNKDLRGMFFIQKVVVIWTIS